MKRVNLILAIIGFLVLGSLAIPHSVHADCQDWTVDCCIDRDSSKTVAATAFSMCWSWSKFSCAPCHGGGDWGWFATWCNSNYPECNNKCWGCLETGCCIDTQGHGYNNCSW